MTLRTSTLRSAAILGAGLMLVGSAAADCQRLLSSNDPTQPNQFTLTFAPEYGGTRLASITTSSITLEACADTALAHFTDYYQEADPLILPDGSSTGDLTILITASRPVSYDPATGQFTTDDDYAIYFAGDLSIYGIQSPFVFEHQSSNGTVNFESATTGTISMNWAGGSFLPNPYVPGDYIPFTYTCQVNTRFQVETGCPQAGCTNDLDADCQVGLGDLSTLLANYGTSGPRVRPSDGDVTHDLTVDLADLASLLAQFGDNCN